MEEEYIEPITSEELQSIFGTNFITKEDIELEIPKHLKGWSINGNLTDEIPEEKEILFGRLFPHQLNEIRNLPPRLAEKKFLEIVKKNKEKYNFNQC